MTRKVDRILSGAVLLPVVFFAMTGGSFAAWRCENCCCPPGLMEAESVEAQQVPADIGLALDQLATTWISTPDCCKFEQRDFETAPSDVQRTGAILSVATSIVAEILPTDVAVAPSHAVWLARSGAGPPDGRSLVVRKQSFLI